MKGKGCPNCQPQVMCERCYRLHARLLVAWEQELQSQGRLATAFTLILESLTGRCKQATESSPELPVGKATRESQSPVGNWIT